MVYTMTVNIYTATSIIIQQKQSHQNESRKLVLIFHSGYCYILLGLTGVQYNGNQNLGVLNTQYKSTR